MRKSLHGKTLPWLALLATIALAEPALGQTDCAPYNSQAVTSAASIGFTSLSPGITSSDISSAIGYWTGKCGADGSNFPSMSVGSSATIPVTVTLVNGRSTNSEGSCGQVQRHTNSANQLTRAEITLWTLRADGTICQEHYIDVMAHEIGHILGFANAPAGCEGRIMGAQIGIQPRTVGTEECNKADDRWITPVERETCGPSCEDDGGGPCGV